MPAVVSDVVQLHCSYRHPLKRAEGVKQGDFQFRCLGRRDLKGTPSHPLPRGEGACLHGQHLGSAPGREIAARHFPGGAQPLVAVRAAQGAVFRGQAQTALERERPAVREKGAETFAEPVEILSADLAARYSLSALELLLQQRGVDCTNRTCRGDRKDGNAISSRRTLLLFVTPFARAAPIRERRGSSFPPRCRRTGLKFARDPSRNDQLGIRVSPVANAWSAGRSRRPGSSFFLSNLGKQALGNF